MRSQTTLIIIIAAIAIVGVAAIGWAMTQNNQTNVVTPEVMEDTPISEDVMIGTEPDAPADGSSEMMVDETGVRTIQMKAGAFYYSPNVITVKKGETVKIVFSAVDMMHDLNIDELDVKLPITNSGETNEVEFTATEVGEFEYYCSVGQHRQNGQVGTLIVEE